MSTPLPTPAHPGAALSFVRPVAPVRSLTCAAEPAPVEIDLARAALVVVDMQNDFIHPDGWFPQAGVDPAPLAAIIPQVRALADGMRAAGAPVVWVNWGVRPDRAEIPDPVVLKSAAGGTRPVYADPSPTGRGQIAVAGQWGAQVLDELGARPEDLLVYKHRLSGFPDSELDSVLRNRGIHTLVFAGINIDRCVFSTLCDASFLGYACLLAEDACATPSPSYVRDAILYLVRLLYGVTVSSPDLIAALQNQETA